MLFWSQGLCQISKDFQPVKCLGDICARSTHQRATRPTCRRTSLAADWPHEWDVSMMCQHILLPSRSHSSRHFLGGCCSRWICIWHFCSLSWVGCILSHVVHRYEILWGMWGSRLGDGLSVWVLQESESLHFILSTSHRALFLPKNSTAFGEAQDWGSREKGPWLGSKLWPKPLGRHPIRTFFLRWPAIRSPSACLLGSLVHVTTSYSMYPTPDIFWGPPLHGTWAAAGREGSNQDREGFVWRPGMEKCTEAIWGWKGRLGPDRFWDFGIERDYEYFRSLFPISPNYLLFLGIVHIYRSGIIFKLQIKHLQANSCLRLDEPKQKGILVIQNELRFGELCSRVAGHLVLVRSLCLQSGWRGLGLYEAFGVPCGTQQTSNAKRLAVIHSSVMWWCYQWFVLCFQLFWWSVSIHESLLDTKSELA